jgi:hypothetical protein
MVKLDFDLLSTVPDAPPAAGPDRALEPPPPDPRPPAEPLLATGCAAEAEADVAKPTGSATTAHISAAPTSRRRGFESDRRIPRRCDGPDVALESGRPGGVESGLLVESCSFMMAILLLRSFDPSAQKFGVR